MITIIMVFYCFFSDVYMCMCCLRRLIVFSYKVLNKYFKKPLRIAQELIETVVCEDKKKQKKVPQIIIQAIVPIF